MYNSIKDTKVLPGLSHAKYVAVASDCWTSRVNQSYISVTTHFLETKPDWKFEHYVRNYLGVTLLNILQKQLRSVYMIGILKNQKSIV